MEMIFFVFGSKINYFLEIVYATKVLLSEYLKKAQSNQKCIFC